MKSYSVTGRDLTSIEYTLYPFEEHDADIVRIQDPYTKRRLQDIFNTRSETNLVTIDKFNVDWDHVDTDNLYDMLCDILSANSDFDTLFVINVSVLADNEKSIEVLSNMGFAIKPILEPIDKYTSLIYTNTTGNKVITYYDTIKNYKITKDLSPILNNK